MPSGRQVPFFSFCHPSILKKVFFEIQIQTQTPQSPEPHKTEKKKKKRRTKQTVPVLQRGKAMKERRKKMTNSINKSVEKRNAYIKFVIFFCLSATSTAVFLLFCFGRLFFLGESTQPV